MLGEEGRRRGEGCQVGWSPVVRWFQAAFHCRHVQQRVSEIAQPSNTAYNWLILKSLHCLLTLRLKGSEEEEV